MVTLDLVLTVQKPAVVQSSVNAHTLSSGDAAAFIQESLANLPVEQTRNASYIYVGILRRAIQEHQIPGQPASR